MGIITTYFLACKENVCDMANADLKDVETLQLAQNTPHRLDVISESRPVSDTVGNFEIAEACRDGSFVPVSVKGSSQKIPRSKIMMSPPGTDLDPKLMTRSKIMTSPPGTDLDPKLTRSEIMTSPPGIELDPNIP